MLCPIIRGWYNLEKMNLVILIRKTFGIFRAGKLIPIFQGKDKTLRKCCRNIKLSGQILIKVPNLVRPGPVLCFASSTVVLTFVRIRQVLEKQVQLPVLPLPLLSYNRII